MVDDTGLVTAVIVEYFKALSVFSIIVLLLKIFKDYMNFASSRVRSFSEASYSVYLFHHPLVIVLSMYFIKNQINMYLAFVLTVVLSYCISFAIHKYIIAKVDCLALAFNGRTYKKNSLPESVK